MVSPENIHPIHFIWIEQFVFVYLRIYITKEKRGMNLKDGGHLEDLEGITGRENKAIIL